MAVLFSWTPARFVEEHKEDVALLFVVNLVQPLIQATELKEAPGDKVIFDALVLEVAVHGLYQLQVGQSKIY